jgi:F-type H+-transporting ATPase subunit epsilon
MSPEAHPGSEERHPTGGGIPDKLSVSVVTPVGSLLSHEADEVVAPGIEGELGVLPGHIPFLTVLKPGVLRVRSGTESQILAVGRGFLEVGVGGVKVLVDQAAWPADINVEQAKTERTKLEEELNKLATAADVEASAVENLTIRRDWAQARIDAAATK